MNEPAENVTLSNGGKYVQHRVYVRKIYKFILKGEFPILLEAVENDYLILYISFHIT